MALWGGMNRTGEATGNMITFEDIRHNEHINIYIKKADEALAALGYTEHAFAHVTKCAVTASRILLELGYDERQAQLAQIAGYMHDIGNIVNRVDHAQSGAVMAFRLLDNMQMDPAEIATVISAIGNHDESTGFPGSPVAAALILADKSDVRRSRDQKVITLEIEIDPQICAVMNYFEIFLGRMVLCRRAAEFLKLRFSLVINGSKLL